MYAFMYKLVARTLSSGLVERILTVLSLLVGFAVLVVRTSKVRVGQTHGIIRPERLETNKCKAGKGVHTKEETTDRKDAENPR